jgi:uncharacterized protein YbaR (Trm112 family)
MAMDKRLLSILCCPVTRKGLSLARPDLLKKINTAIGASKLVNRDGTALSATLDEALITDDGKIMYLLRAFRDPFSPAIWLPAMSRCS